MTAELLPIISQFGAAGLIGLLWLVERRHSSNRDRQLTESHGRLMEQQQIMNAALDVIRENTRAIAALEHTQRQLIELAAHLGMNASKRTR